MTLRIHGPGVTPHVGEVFNVLVTSDNPGVVSLSYGAGLTGPATVEIPGTRVYWATTEKYLAIPSVCQSRVDCTWLFEVDWEKVQNAEASTGTALASKLLIGSIKTSWAGNRYNWGMYAARSLNGSYVSFAESLTAASTPTNRAGPSISRSIVTKVRYAITKTSAGELKIYAVSRTSPAPVTFTQVSTGTMGVDEVLIVWGPLSYFAKILHICDNTELDNWLDNSVIPTTDQEIVLPFNHELAPSPNQKFYDISGNDYDPYELAINEFHAPGAVNYNTDTSPVTPYALIAVAAVSTTGTTIDATRPRQGVPSRASYGERTEVADQLALTVIPPLTNEQGTAQLMIYASKAGTATIAMDVPGIIAFPASAVVVVGKNQISGTITGAGTVVVTTTLDGVSDSTTFVIENITTLVKSGPSQQYQVYLP